MGKAGNYIKSQLQQSHRRHAQRAKRGAMIKAQRRQSNSSNLSRVASAGQTSRTHNKQSFVNKYINNKIDTTTTATTTSAISDTINTTIKKGKYIEFPTVEQQEVLLSQWSQACRLQTPSHALCSLLHACLHSLPSAEEKIMEETTQETNDRTSKKDGAAAKHHEISHELRYDVYTTLEMMAEALIETANTPAAVELDSEDEWNDAAGNNIPKEEEDEDEEQETKEKAKSSNKVYSARAKRKRSRMSELEHDETNAGNVLREHEEEEREKGDNNDEEQWEELTMEKRVLQGRNEIHERSVLEEIICDENGRRVIELLLESLQRTSHIMYHKVESLLMSFFEEDPELAKHYIACRVMSGLVMFGSNPIRERVLQLFKLEAAEAEVEEQDNHIHSEQSNKENILSSQKETSKLFELLTNRHTAGTITRLLDCYSQSTRSWLVNELQLFHANTLLSSSEQEEQELSMNINGKEIKEQCNAKLLTLIENPVSHSVLTKLLTSDLRVKLITDCLNIHALLKSKRGMTFLAALLDLNEQNENDTSNCNCTVTHEASNEQEQEKKYEANMSTSEIKNKFNAKTACALLDTLVQAFGLKLYEMSIDSRANFIVQSVLNLIPFTSESSKEYLQLFLTCVCQNFNKINNNRKKITSGNENKKEDKFKKEQCTKFTEVIESAKSENWKLGKLSSQNEKVATMALGALCDNNIGIHVIIKLCEVTMKIDTNNDQKQQHQEEEEEKFNLLTGKHKHVTKNKESNREEIKANKNNQKVKQSLDKVCSFTVTEQIAALMINRNNILDLMKSANGSMLVRQLMPIIQCNMNERYSSHLIKMTIARESVELAYDAFGNLVLQEYLRYLSTNEISEFTKLLIHRNNGKELYKMTQQQFASHVIYKLFELADSSTITMLSKALEPNLMEMACHVNGRYIVEKMLCVSKAIQTKLADSFLTLATQKGTQTVLTKLINELDVHSQTRLVENIIKPHFRELAMQQNASIVLQKIILNNNNIKDNLAKFIKLNPQKNCEMSRNFYGKFVVNLLL